jgi:CBS domain-containing membrane protein
LKISLTVADLMTSRVFAVRADETVAVLVDLMREHHVRHVPVVDDEGELLGLVSHRDLLRNSLIEQDDEVQVDKEEILERLQVRDLMLGEVDRVTPETDIREAAQLMLDHKYGCLPVVEGNRLVGILTESDFVRLMAGGN